MTQSAQQHCPHDRQISCGNCRLSSICLPISMHISDIDKVNDIIQRGRPLQKGDYLYRANEPFQSVYAVRSGTVKSITLSDDGEEQVTGFYLPGEILGMEGIAQDRYTNSAIALETASICEIPFHSLEDLSLRIPSLQRHFFQLMSKEITQEQQLAGLLSKSTAEQRVAALLLSISARNKARQLSATAFRLPMSRTDIGNFLGLTIETVSRVFTRLQKQGIIRVDKKEVQVEDIDALRKLSSALG
ncbi:fumarate/nitrate reduction transcriptional regulator Fnr [Marinimicrobium alkaliphilum]|uniref:fumarate/nitrate reduction transcriptional regulator Fnr n=1 Tax=Marinimicrobium alkaliphilum TaxID=2202654 RepID=UPI000DBA4395|nr:fumarate/nitrate reduction transcriptional regulator Fnr [Marinimicrobium alkaliphilum]